MARTRNQSPASVMDRKEVEPITEKIASKTKSMTPPVETAPEPLPQGKKSTKALGVLTLLCAILLATASAVTMVSPALSKSCGSCESAVLCAEEGKATAAVEFGGVTFLLADAQAAAAFVAAPEEHIPTMTMATSFWTSPTYLTGQTPPAEVCSCP